VLVRRPAPPGIRPFLENKRSMQGKFKATHTAKKDYSGTQARVAMEVVIAVQSG